MSPRLENASIRAESVPAFGWRLYLSIVFAVDVIPNGPRASGIHNDNDGDDDVLETEDDSMVADDVSVGDGNMNVRVGCRVKRLEAHVREHQRSRHGGCSARAVRVMRCMEV
mmetsp:Transcript_10654/g.22592  ORF Transcript_10654/g.22592 Transcript_10654/m.22592 type:complete len:112 (-) Transcript_10654:828-1163(-)